MPERGGRARAEINSSWTEEGNRKERKKPIGKTVPAADSDCRSGGHTGAHHHGHAHVHGLGGGAPVDIVETPGEYAFLLGVPDGDGFPVA